MALLKLLDVKRIEVPDEKDSLYRVYIDYGTGDIIKSYQTAATYEEFMLEQELLAAGVDAELLGKYKDAVQEVMREEATYDEGYTD